MTAFNLTSRSPHGVQSEPGVLSLTESTPIKKHVTSTSRFGTSPFTSSSSSNTVQDRRAFMDAADEMNDLWVNVRSGDILAMLPKCDGMPQVKPEVFQIGTVTEERMYPLVLDACRPYHKKSWNTLDTHNYHDPNSGFFLSRQVSPDALTFSHHLGIPRKGNPCDTSRAELFWEMKPRHTLDGFNERDTTPFERESDDGKRTRGQLTMYANALQGSQHRTHVFGVFLFLKHGRVYCRLICHTRSGAYVSDDEPAQKALPEFLWRFTHATPAQRGHDETVIRLQPKTKPSKLSDYDLTRNDIKDATEKLGLDPDKSHTLYLIPVHGKESNGQSVKTSYIVHKSFVGAHLLPVGRGTACFIAWDYKEKKRVLLKDQWRVQAYHPEGETYMKLDKAGVQHVPRVKAYGDVLNQRCGQDVSERRHDFEEDEDERSRAPFRVLVHTRIVLDIVGQPLRCFQSTWELVNGMLQVLKAHRDAYNAGILHRDMSEGNWIFGDGTSGCRPGFLIDWELAKMRSETRARSSARTGTWQFLSVRLLQDPNGTHELSDDLESAVWVLCWTLVKFANNGLTPSERATILNMFEYNEDNPALQKYYFALAPISLAGRLGLVSPGSPEALINLVDKIGTEMMNKYIALYKPSNSPQSYQLSSYQWLIETLEEALNDQEWKQTSDPAQKNQVTFQSKPAETKQPSSNKSSRKRKLQSMQDVLSPEMKKRAKAGEGKQTAEEDTGEEDTGEVKSSDEPDDDMSGDWLPRNKGRFSK